MNRTKELFGMPSQKSVCSWTFFSVLLGTTGPISLLPASPYMYSHLYLSPTTWVSSEEHRLVKYYD